MGVFCWMLGPVRGARRYTLRMLELVRSFFAGSGAFVLLGALEYAATNLHLLYLDEETTRLVTAKISVAIFLIHLSLQFFQGSRQPPSA